MGCRRVAPASLAPLMSPAATRPPLAGEPPRPERGMWAWWLGPIAVAAAFFVVVLLALLATVIAGADGANRLFDDYPQWTGLVQDAAWIAVAILTPLLVARHLRPQQLGLRAAPLRRGALVLVLALVSFYALSAAYSAIAGLTEDSNTLLQNTGIGRSVGSDLGYVALFVVAAPVAEELLFRGLLFRTIADKIGVWPGALLSGAFFGAIHLGNGQDAFIPVLIALGVILALAYDYSATLYVAIAIHAINNAISTGAGSQFAAPWVTAVLVAGPLLALLTAWTIAKAIAATLPQTPGPALQLPATPPA